MQLILDLQRRGEKSGRAMQARAENVAHRDLTALCSSFKEEDSSALCPLPLLSKRDTISFAQMASTLRDPGKQTELLLWERHLPTEVILSAIRSSMRCVQNKLSLAERSILPASRLLSRLRAVRPAQRTYRLTLPMPIWKVMGWQECK